MKISSILNLAMKFHFISFKHLLPISEDVPRWMSISVSNNNNNDNNLFSFLYKSNVEKTHVKSLMNTPWGSLSS